MEARDVQGVIETLREQIAVLMGRVSGEQRVKVQAFEQDKPQIRQLIQALEGSRQVLDAELKELQAHPASAKAAVKKTTQAFSAGFGALKGKAAPKAAEGSKLSDEELRSERQQLSGALQQLDQRIDGIRQELASHMRPDERDMWETNLVMMQDTRRMHQEEIQMLELELLTRERAARAAAELAEAEASGTAAISRTKDQLSAMDARIDRLKAQLYFPAVEGYCLALGGTGVYIGAKDYLISEIVGGFSATADCGPSAHKAGGKVGRITLQIGAHAAPPPPGAGAAPTGPEALSKPLSNSFKLRPSGGSVAATNSAAGAALPSQTPTASSIGPGKESKGKRMAMKFMNKLGNKDKFVQNMPGLGRLTHKQESSAEVDDGGASSLQQRLAGRILSSSSAGPAAAEQRTPTIRHIDDDDDDDAENDTLGTMPSMELPAGGTASGEDWDRATSGAGSASGMDTSSQVAGRRGLWAVIRCQDVGLLGERGSKVPNATIGQLSIEVEVAMTLNLEYSSVTGWQAGAKPQWDIVHLRRAVTGNSVPMPRAVLKLVLSMLVPRLLQRYLLSQLLPEIGKYLIEAEQSIHLSGEISLLGPPLGTVDADLGFQMGAQPQGNPRAAQQQARQHAASQEARSQLGLNVEQAAVLGDIFGGLFTLFPEGQAIGAAAPCSLSAITAFCRNNSSSPTHWEQMCAVIDTAARLIAKHRFIAAPPPFHVLMGSHIRPFLLKPVRARLVLQKLELAVSVDAVVSAVRAYLERSCRELFAKGPAGQSGLFEEQGEDSLAGQLSILGSWHTWLLGHLRHFKSKFRGSTASAVGTVDCRSIAAGLENCRFEGPVRIHLPIPNGIGKVDEEGTFSLLIPLPTASQANVAGTFMEGLRAALNTPIALLHTPAEHAKPGPVSLDRQGSQAVDVLKMSPADWFGRWQESGAGEALPGTEDYPSSLGKISAAGARVRVKLDEARIEELLRGSDSAGSSAAARVLSCLGDMGQVSFVPHHGDNGNYYAVAVETGEVSNLAAELGTVSFRSGAGISPGRVVRLAHALARASLLTFKGKEEASEAMVQLDQSFEGAYEHLVREALDAQMCLHSRSFVQGEHLLLCLSGPGADEAIPFPLTATNDVDMVTLVSMIRGEWHPFG